MSTRPWLWTSSCQILFAQRGQSRDWPETCWKVNKAGGKSREEAAGGDGAPKRGREAAGGTRGAGGVEAAPSAAWLVKFCPGFSLRVQRLMNFTCLEGERVKESRDIPLLILCLLPAAVRNGGKTWGFLLCLLQDWKHSTRRRLPVLSELQRSNYIGKTVLLLVDLVLLVKVV